MKAVSLSLVDLERHWPVDLLPERSADPLKAWLERHPGVEVITRDRSTEYARGATEGAPKALQADLAWRSTRASLAATMLGGPTG